MTDRLEFKVVQAEGLNIVSKTTYVLVSLGLEILGTRLVEHPAWNAEKLLFSRFTSHESECAQLFVMKKDPLHPEGCSCIGEMSVPISVYYNNPHREVDGWYNVLEPYEHPPEDLNMDMGGDMSGSGNVDVDPSSVVVVGRIRLIGTFLTDTSPEPETTKRNLLQVHVFHAFNLKDASGKGVEAVAVVEASGQRRKTRVCKRSVIPTWEEGMSLHICDVLEVVHIVVRNILPNARSIILGKVRIPMSEVASGGNRGITKQYPLLNDDLIEDEPRGFLQVSLKWVYDSSFDDVGGRRRARVRRSTKLSEDVRRLNATRSTTAADPGDCRLTPHNSSYVVFEEWEGALTAVIAGAVRSSGDSATINGPTAPIEDSNRGGSGEMTPPTTPRRGKYGVGRDRDRGRGGSGNNSARSSARNSSVCDGHEEKKSIEAVLPVSGAGGDGATINGPTAPIENSNRGGSREMTPPTTPRRGKYGVGRDRDRGRGGSGNNSARSSARNSSVCDGHEEKKSIEAVLPVSGAGDHIEVPEAEFLQYIPDEAHGEEQTERGELNDDDVDDGVGYEEDEYDRGISMSARREFKDSRGGGTYFRGPTKAPSERGCEQSLVLLRSLLLPPEFFQSTYLQEQEKGCTALERGCVGCKFPTL